MTGFDRISVRICAGFLGLVPDCPVWAGGADVVGEIEDWGGGRADCAGEVGRDGEGSGEGADGGVVFGDEIESLQEELVGSPVAVRPVGGVDVGQV